MEEGEAKEAPELPTFKRGAEDRHATGPGDQSATELLPSELIAIYIYIMVVRSGITVPPMGIVGSRRLY